MHVTFFKIKISKNPTWTLKIITAYIIIYDEVEIIGLIIVKIIDF